MASKPYGTLYIGVTADLARRVHEHREGLVEGFTKRYGVAQLVYYERHDDIRDAIQREKTTKHWPRPRKINAIAALNPDWADLYPTLSARRPRWMAGTSPAMTL